MKIDLYAVDGSKKGEIELNARIFEAKINPDLMHRAVLLRLANRRQPVAHSKDRGEVKYSTRKMFKQKGTGNARRGARSTNILRGGGVTHGPRNVANYSKMMPKKERRAALFSALSAKAQVASLFAWEGLKLEVPKTKEFVSVLTKLPEGKKYLFVLPEKDKILSKSGSNVPGVSFITANYINPYDLLLADKVCFIGNSLEVIDNTFVK
jgi:large subunit ribosomal protein L4